MMRLQMRAYSTKFKEGDRVIVKPLWKTVTTKKWLSNPLQPGETVNLNHGRIPCSDIISSYSNSKIFTLSGKKKLSKYIISTPSTEEYINLITREAQPIYPLDAAAIVTLADLHVDYPDLDHDTGELSSPPLHFFESGTGHGSLSLQIVKAIHPANALAKMTDNNDLRGAILHSIDCNSKHSHVGQNTVTQFRNGMYRRDAEFYVSPSPKDWLYGEEADKWRKVSPLMEDEIEFNHKEAFLSGAFLDMGGFEKYLEDVGRCLKVDGFLIVFCPSITQIVEGIKVVDKGKTGLVHVKTIQLLDGAGGGLKEWDTRKTFIRATNEEAFTVRPKVGMRTCGGGFIGIFKKVAVGLDINAAVKEMEDFVPIETEDDKHKKEKRKGETERKVEKKLEKLEDGKTPKDTVTLSGSEDVNVDEKENKNKIEKTQFQKVFSDCQGEIYFGDMSDVKISKKE